MQQVESVKIYYVYSTDVDVDERNKWSMWKIYYVYSTDVDEDERATDKSE